MTTPLTVECALPLSRRGVGGRTVRDPAPRPINAEPSPVGRIPRVARLMALAIQMNGLLRDGTVHDQAELAQLGQVTQARMSQILSLTLLAPDIQEAILFLPPVLHGRPSLILADLLPIAREWEWADQRRIWRKLIEK